MDYFYLDASVLVKAYVWETGTADLIQILREARERPARARVLTSRVAFVEGMSALSRREAGGFLTRAQAAQLATRLTADFIGSALPYAVLQVATPVVHHAADLARRHRLRALDAIHLATGLAARYNAPAIATFHFGSADHRLSSAAVLEQLGIFDPRTPVPSSAGSPVAPPA